MADNIALIKLEVQVADGELKVDRLKSKLKGLTKGGEDYNLTLKRIQIAEDNLNKVQSKKISVQSNLEQSTKKLTKTQVQAKDATGAYTSSALELGRVISDAPYGIRGMANNLTQLISQMGFAAKTAGGLGAAFRGLWGALMGPLGVVLAFTAVISALDFFFGANEKAEKSTDDLTDSIQDFADVLSKNANASIKEYLKLMKEKEQLDKNLKKAADEIEEVEERLAKATERRIVHENNLKNAVHNRDLIQKQLNQASEHEIKLQSELESIYTNAAKAVNEYRENKEELNNVDEEVVDGSLKHLKQLLSQQKKYRDEVSTTRKTYDSISSVIDEIQRKIDVIEGKEKDRDKVKAIFDFETPEEIEKKAQKHAKALFEALEKTYGKTKSAKDILSIPVELDLKPIGKAAVPTIPKEDFEFYAQQYTELMSGVSDFIGAEYDRQLTIEANHTAKLNEELNNRLLNEKLSANERKNIQNQIAINDEALRKKQNAIKKKQFDTQKAFNISMSVANTVSAAISAANQTYGGPVAKIAAMTAVIGAGLANVAMIARQKFQPDAAGVPLRTTGTGGSAGGTGVGDRSFNFNLVGNTLGNQITDAIQGQFDQPLKAYVVSRDITSQQALDANIKGTASF